MASPTVAWRMAASACILSLAAAAAPSITTYFAPYDGPARYTAMSNTSVLQADLALVQEVVAAKKAHDAQQGKGPARRDDAGSFNVKFCVYNLLDDDYIQALIEAHNAGVFVQVVMDYNNINEPYVQTYARFRDAGLAVAPFRNTTQKELTPQQLASLNLIGAKVTGIMHMKLRYFSWLAAPGATEATEVVVTGSLNPEDTALKNEDTLVVIRDDPDTIAAYTRAYASVLAPKPTATNDYDASRPVNVMFSQAVVEKGSEATCFARRVLLSLVRSETESALLSVYSLRSLDDGTGLPLVEELCAARARGVAVAVVTDKGQADGEAGFAGGDNTLTALRMWRCGIPVYKAENYATKYTALHHKNAVFGLKKRSIVWTDTANWSEASMGNGTSDAKPHNSETSLIIDSQKADAGRMGLRFVSNFLQLVRKYAYQQACPYTRVSGNRSYTERAQCATDMKWNQPDWVQPGARNVTASLVAAAEAGAEGTWPRVKVTFTVAATPLLPTGDADQGGAGQLLLSVNGAANTTVPLSPAPGGAGSQAVATLPFGSVVDVTVVPMQGGAQAYQRTVVADAAFAWGANPPARRSDAELDSMQLTVSV